MITILHGEDSVTSRKDLEEARENFAGEVVLINAKEIDKTDFYQVLESNSLFQNQKLVIIENFFLVKNMEIPPDLGSTEVIFWENDEIPKTKLALFPGATVKQFKTSPIIFNFVDQLKPNNGIVLVGLFRLCLAKDNEPEIIFTMIVRQFRLMLDPSGALPWQKSKVAAQSKLFGEEKLLKIYSGLLLVDFENKSGQTILSLSDTLELFLLDL